MTEQSEKGAVFDTAIDAIEGGYEFLLAYAAQGRRSDREGVATQEPRSRLQAMARALEELPQLARLAAAEHDAVHDARLIETAGAFFAAIERDCEVSCAAVNLVLAQRDIGSQLIDNLNASIHLRAVLTDIFLLDEALKAASAK